MRKFGLTMVFVLVFLAVVGILPVLAEDYSPVVNSDIQQVQLTETQKEELATLYKEIFAKKKEVVSKYVEYGVISKEKGEEILSRLDKRYKMLEQNDFMPKWDKYKKRYS